MRSVIAVSMWIGALTAVHAQGVCIKPNTPPCAIESSPFSSEASFDQCRAQMIGYKGQMDAYASCLDESEWPTDGLFARTELENTLARFNRRARGEQD